MDARHASTTTIRLAALLLATLASACSRSPAPAANAAGTPASDTVTINDHQAAHVTAIAVGLREFDQRSEAVGYLDFDQDHLAQVYPAYQGRVRQVLVKAGDEVTKGQPLISLESRELKATVLLAPHHGSGTSSTLPFLKTVQPQVAIFQVGYRNRFHHPKAEVFERYGALGIERLRSDESGAVKLQLGGGMAIEEYRRATPHYWYGS